MRRVVDSFLGPDRLLPIHCNSWGRETFVVVAATRTFAKEHSEFIRHFVGVLSRLVDSFIDYLGEKDERNSARWEPDVSQHSLIPSMVDALVLEDEIHMEPSADALFRQRIELDLFDDNDALEQMTCSRMGPGPGFCQTPTDQHWALRQTAEFLVSEKVLAHMGPMQDIGGARECLAKDGFCGSDIIDGSFLRVARRDCTNCMLVGRYANVVPRVNSTQNGQDQLLRALEVNDQSSGHSFYATEEVGRSGGDSTCMTNVANGIIRLGSNSPVEGEFGDGANGDQGKSYSDNMHCEWEIRGVDCGFPSDICNALVQLEFSRVRLWSGDFIRIYADPENVCQADSGSSYMIAQISAFDEIPPSIRARGCVRVVFETDSNNERFYATNQGDGFLISYNRNHEGCLTDTDCSNRKCVEGMCYCDGESWGADCTSTDHCFGTSRVALEGGSVKTAAISGDAPRMGTLSDYKSPQSYEKYSNDAFCAFEIEMPSAAHSFVKVEIFYDVSFKSSLSRDSLLSYSTIPLIKQTIYRLNQRMT